MARRSLLFVLLALALTACEIRTHLNIDASDVSNGQITAQVGFDEDFREAMEEFGGGGDLLAEVETSAPSEGWEVEHFTDGDIEGVTLTQDFSSIEDLQNILSTSSIASGESGGWEDLTFTETDDSIRFEASLSAPGMEGAEDIGMDEVSAFLDFDFQIAVTFPGDVLEHNGVLEERTVVWDLDEDALADAELFAEARKGGSFPWTVIGGVLLALVVIGVVSWSILSRQRRPREVEIVIEQPTEPVEVVATDE
ncbi:MAG: LppM family (lipo)protein [Acidimicrobiia bacterium]